MGNDDGGVGKWTERLNQIAKVDDGNWTNILPKTLLLPLIAFFTSVADAIGAFFGIPINVADALGEGVGDLIDATLGGGAQIIDLSAIESAESLTEGVWAQFGPFTFVIGIGVVILAAYVIARVRSQEATSNVWFFLPFDLPDWGPFGADEEGEN